MKMLILNETMNEIQPASTKRKRSTITLETKRQIIDASAGKSSSQLGKQFSLPPTTIRSILGKKDSVINAIGEGKDTNLARLQPVKHANLDNEILHWIKTVKSQNVSLSGPLLKVFLLILSYFYSRIAIFFQEKSIGVGEPVKH
jgi:hypothetical protein